VTTRSGRSAVNKQKGKPSQTKFTSLENFVHFTLISCSPVSGRQHQIRIHLASQNAPIVADKIYGGELPFLSDLKKKFNLKKGSEEQPMINRFALHAHALNFQDINGKTLNIVADYPKDFNVFLSQLKKFDLTNY
jgi:23S rRNA pseudouridine955/2504/2580 synthase